MDYGKAAEQMMRMDDATWWRHANPASGWTRMPILAGLALAIFSRVWIGWWCLVPVALLLVWNWLNPRAFASPQSLDSWMTRAVLGERIWLNRQTKPIPPNHARMANMLSLAATFGLLPLVYGLWVLDPMATASGVIIATGAKLWFLDRMVWLYEDTKADHPEYLRPPGS